MALGTLHDHPKLHRLEYLTGLSPMILVGALERLWEYTRRHQKDGGVGRADDLDIEIWTGWKKLLSQLSESALGALQERSLCNLLLAAGFLDEHPDPKIRYVIHDWHDHCDAYTHSALARNKLRFANGANPNTSRLGRAEREAAEAFYNGENGERTKSAQRAHRERSESAHEAHKERLTRTCAGVTRPDSRLQTPDPTNPPPPSAAELEPPVGRSVGRSVRGEQSEQPAAEREPDTPGFARFLAACLKRDEHYAARARAIWRRAEHEPDSDRIVAATELLMATYASPRFAANPARILAERLWEPYAPPDGSAEPEPLPPEIQAEFDRFAEEARREFARRSGGEDVREAKVAKTT